MALLPPMYLDCVVAMGTKGKDGEIAWDATGFFYGHKVSGPRAKTKRYAIVIATNRHVFDDEERIYIRCNPIVGRKAQEFSVELLDQDGNRNWTSHENRDIDVAVLPIDASALKRAGTQFAIFTNDVDTANIRKLKDLGILEGDSVYILGFPMRIVGERRNTVLVRGGTIARIRDVLSKDNDEMLVDALLFPGNSGGPVVSKPQITKVEGTKSQDAAYLIGIVKSYVPYRDVAISVQTSRPRVIFEENSGLAAVYPIDFVQEIAKIYVRSLREKRKH